MSRTALRRVYRKVPALECKGLCHETCGPIPLTAMERERIEESIGHPIGAVGDDMTCPLLDDNNRCSVYALRPLICRMWGAEETMRCPHGCIPKRYLTMDEGGALIQEITAVGGMMTFTVEGGAFDNLTFAKDFAKEWRAQEDAEESR